MSTWAVLVAAGRGERLGGDRPKAFAPLRGRPLLAESLERLEASDWIDAIVVVAPEGWEEPSILVAEELGCGKVTATVTGGATRAESVRLGVAEADGDAAALVVHDAARPLLPAEVIERVLEALGSGWDGAVPGLPVADVVDLEPELDGQPLPLGVEDRLDVEVEVVDAALALVVVDPDLCGLAEVVDVLGEADLVHPPRRGRLEVGRKRGRRVVDLL